ncbi:carboxymuconolactone decarboxylase family protein [Acerihabitans sp. KWT182]|uniref:Carboxymuconolactone decarboxylase family protein n=1 Tax=Acerihabitans sp. KWT182 TaxID=3157919 RepID=A0AAU7QBX4_9GAMM
MTENTPLQQIADVAPKLAELSQQVLFGDIWRRSALSPRDRSLATLAALIALGREGQLAWHFDFGMSNGLTRPELIEIITHLAFYAGWPAAASALACLPKEEE